MRTPRYKVGDNVKGRIILEVFTRDKVDGTLLGFTYGYRYKNEPKEIDTLYCTQETLYQYEIKNKHRK